jgi:hypothetical protein
LRKIDRSYSTLDTLINVNARTKSRIINFF